MTCHLWISSSVVTGSRRWLLRMSPIVPCGITQRSVIMTSAETQCVLNPTGRQRRSSVMERANLQPFLHWGSSPSYLFAFISVWTVGNIKRRIRWFKLLISYQKVIYQQSQCSFPDKIIFASPAGSNAANFLCKKLDLRLVEKYKNVEKEAVKKKSL